LARALRGINKRFNAAEFDSLRISRFPGFYVASVTMEARQIQQNTSLDVVVESHPLAIPAR
jgi:acetolactate synthase regulatory subunit